jgi:sporulation-control protein spo0M
MGFFDKIKVAVGIGGAKVSFNVEPDQEIRQNGYFEGEVVLRGGNVEQKLTELTLDVIQTETWAEIHEETYVDHFDGDVEAHVHEHQRERSTTVHKMVIADEQVILPEEEYVFPFEITIPENAPITTETVSWKLWTNADIPGALDPSAAFHFKVLPSPAVNAFDRVMEDFGFEQADYGNEDDFEGIWVDYSPLGEMRRHFDLIEASFWNEDGDLQVELKLDLQEHSMFDALGSMLGADKRTVNLSLPGESLFRNSDRSEPDMEYIKERLQEIFSHFSK